MPKTNHPDPARQPDGTFAKGTSGNPKGRPRSEITALRMQIAPQAEAIIQQVINQALEGDLAAAKLVLDRIIPPLKPITTPIRTSFSEEKNLTGQAKSILAAASSGEVSSDIAAQLIQALTGVCRISETEDLKDRIEALEAAIKPTPKKS